MSTKSANATHGGEPIRFHDGPPGIASDATDRELRASDALARGMLDSVVVGVIRFDKQRRVEYLNAFARRMLEPFASFLDSDVSLASFQPYTIWPDGSVCRMEDYPASKCFETGLPQGPTTIGLRRETGPTVWATISVVPVLDPATRKTESVIATFVDITRQKQIEESLRQSEDRYRHLVEQAPDAIVVHQDGKIVFVNDAGVKLWRAEGRADLIGRPVLDFVHPRYRELVKRRIEQAQQGEVVPLVDQLHVRLDGSKVRVEVTGMACIYDGKPSVQAILRDVTRRRRIERQVRRQRELLKKFFDRVPLLVCMFDAAGRIKMVNREWNRVLGWGMDLTLPQLLERYYPDPQDRQKAIEYMQAAPSGWIDSRIKARDGRTLIISSALVLLSDGTRIGIVQDVTQRKEAEAALRQYKDELEQRVALRTEELVRKNAQLEAEVTVRRQTEEQLQEKQQTLEQMLDMHERYRQLLAYEVHDTFVQDVIAALMFLDVFHDRRSEAGDGDLRTIEQSLALLRKSIKAARRMISGLRPPIIDERGVVPAIEYLVSELNAQGMEIKLEHDVRVQRLAPVMEAALFRIVQEALTNVQRHSGSKFAQVKLTQTAGRLRLEVRDFGAGFDPQTIGKEHFGLRGITERARLLGGTVAVQSAPGKGAEIIVEMPVTPASGPTRKETQKGAN